MRTACYHVSAIVGFSLMSVSFVQSAMAFPMPTNNNLGAYEEASTQEDIVEAGVDFTSIVALNNCSGALVRFKSSRPQDKALILTNGHCYENGMPGPGEVLVNKPSSRTFRLLSSDGSSRLASFRAERLIYATMTSTDAALYRLNTSYSAISRSTGVTALTLADKRPEAGAPIRVVSGYWRKIYSCSISNFVHELREGVWTSKDSIKYRQPGCETIGGTSGSPIIHAETKEVIGVNNTGNEDGERCTDNNPCEVDVDGNVTFEKGASYGQQTYIFYSCLTASNTLDLNKAGCLLPKPAGNLR